ncbi:hypothetical protein U0070_020531 [Myodes glareolus]|uniref:Uncharacterized protein n=1 Tax=Myodes glareolus TaxID=447135 RepID=A0AAW0JAR3_MYOGA
MESKPIGVMSLPSHWQAPRWILRGLGRSSGGGYLFPSEAGLGSEDDARPSETSKAVEKRERSLPRLNIHSGLWILASTVVTYYVDFKTLKENFHTNNCWFLFGGTLLFVSLSIAFYCIVYLEWYHGIGEYDIKYLTLVPITTATFIAAGICFNLALWNVWSFFTPLLLFTPLMGVVRFISLHMKEKPVSPYPQEDGDRNFKRPSIQGIASFAHYQERRLQQWLPPIGRSGPLGEPGSTLISSDPLTDAAMKIIYHSEAYSAIANWIFPFYYLQKGHICFFPSPEYSQLGCAVSLALFLRPLWNASVQVARNVKQVKDPGFLKIQFVYMRDNLGHILKGPPHEQGSGDPKRKRTLEQARTHEAQAGLEHNAQTLQVVPSFTQLGLSCRSKAAEEIRGDKLVQVLQLLKAADLGGQFLDLVVEEVKHLQVLQFCYVWGHSYGNGDATKSILPPKAKKQNCEE